MRIAFAAGGTGGHVFPAVAVAREIGRKRPGSEILFIGGTRGIERKIAEESGFPFRTIPAAGFPRRLSIALAPFVWNLAVSVARSREYLRDFHPAVLMATGGYVSGPPIVAARSLGVPVVIQEQNSLPGLSNRTLGRFAEVVFLGFEDAAGRFGKHVRTLFTGNPIRPEIGRAERNESARLFDLDPAAKTILVFGGSQGAQAINRTASDALGRFRERGIQILWQCGDREFDRWKEYAGPGVRVLPFIADMAAAYAACDLVVARAGAMSVAEITVCGLPAVFVPLPGAAENHQEFNARSLERAGAAAVILERDLTPDVLADTALGILDDGARSGAMETASHSLGRPDAAEVIADMIVSRFAEN